MVRGQESSCPRKHSSPLAEVHTARFFDPANILLERTGQHPGMELETQKWNILIHWLESRGMRIPTGGLAVEYREFEGSGRGLAVTRDVGVSFVRSNARKQVLDADSQTRSCSQSLNPA